MEKFYTILTNVGRAKIANAHANKVALELKEMAVGDGGGAYYNPPEDATALKNETYRREMNNLSTDLDNPNYLVCEMVIPSTAGGFYIREAGIFDVDGDMIAIGKIPETYKPTLESGAAKDLYMRFIIEVANASAVTLKIDPSVVLATKEMSEKAAADAVTKHLGQINPHKQYNLTFPLSLEKGGTGNTTGIPCLEHKRLSPEVVVDRILPDCAVGETIHIQRLMSDGIGYYLPEGGTFSFSQWTFDHAGYIGISNLFFAGGSMVGQGACGNIPSICVQYTRIL